MIRTLFPTGFPAAEPRPSGSWGRALLAALVLSALLILLYRPAVDFRLLALDDLPGTVNNDRVAKGLDATNIVRAFTEVREGWQGGGGIYVPLVELSFMADVELFGMSPRGFHLTNILLYAVDMALLLLVLWRMTGALGKSAFAAALVAFHPLRVESVAWVAERKDVLSVLFLLLSLACYLRYARTGKRGWYGALILCFLLGLLSKPMLVTLPLLLLLLDFWPLGRLRPVPSEGAPASPGRRLMALVAEKVPLLALSALLSLLTYQLHQERSLHPGLSLVSRLEHSFSADLFYMYQTFWPRDLVFRFYKIPWERFSGTLAPMAAGVAVVTALVARFAGKRPYLAFGWGWYMVALFPVSGVVGPFGTQWISDRYTFIPHVGLAVAFAWLAAGVSPRRSGAILPALAVVLLLPMALFSRKQLYYWRDGATLLGKGVESSREDPWYLNLYVAELMIRGDLPRAREEQERLLPFAMNPRYAGADIQSQYLEILNRMGDRRGAIVQARKFLQQDPRFYKTRIRLAEDLLAEGRFDEAAEEYRRVLEVPMLRPHERSYLLERSGSVLLRMGKDNEALSRFAGALEFDLGGLRPRLGIAELLLERGDVVGAVRLYEEVSRRAPGKAESLYARGRILEAAGMNPQARSVYESALKAPALFPETIDAVQMRLGQRP